MIFDAANIKRFPHSFIAEGSAILDMPQRIPGIRSQLPGNPIGRANGRSVVRSSRMDEDLIYPRRLGYGVVGLAVHKYSPRQANPV